MSGVDESTPLVISTNSWLPESSNICPVVIRLDLSACNALVTQIGQLTLCTRTSAPAAST